MVPRCGVLRQGVFYLIKEEEVCWTKDMIKTRGRINEHGKVSGYFTSGDLSKAGLHSHSCKCHWKIAHSTLGTAPFKILLLDIKSTRHDICGSQAWIMRALPHKPKSWKTKKYGKRRDENHVKSFKWAWAWKRYAEAFVNNGRN